MKMKQSNLVLFALAFVVIFTAETFACSCMPSHPQTSYCNSDFVIVARILRRSNRRINNQHIYKIDIVKQYKASEKADQFLKQGRLLTAPNDGLCGVDFKIGQLYAIAGNSQKVNLCQYVKEYSLMSITEKRGIAGAYKKGCACEINLCFGNGGCESSPGSCEWSPHNHCDTEYGICIPTKPVRNSLIYKTNKCSWKKSPNYMNCLNDP